MEVDAAFSIFSNEMDTSMAISFVRLIHPTDD
jgi:hypothetical protein